MRLSDGIERLRCAWSGHQPIKAYDREQDRVYLRCLNCRWESAGWACKPAAKQKVAYLNLMVIRSRKVRAA